MSERSVKTIFIGTCTECNCPTIEGDQPDRHSNPATCRINIRKAREQQQDEGQGKSNRAA